MINAICIDERDNVGTAVAAIKAGETAFYLMKEGDIHFTQIKEDIPSFHKYALTDIPKDAPLVKYGEHIGFAKEDIAEGQYVHTHNVYSKRENLR